jgi:hypothetical protein
VNSLHTSALVNMSANCQSRSDSPQRLPKRLTSHRPAILSFIAVVLGRRMRHHNIRIQRYAFPDVGGFFGTVPKCPHVMRRGKRRTEDFKGGLWAGGRGESDGSLFMLQP